MIKNEPNTTMGSRGLPVAERRQIENEMIFRRANEKVGDGLDEIDAMYIEDNRPDLIRTKDLTLHFICECSDENCNDRLAIKLSVYKEVHENRDTFIAKHGHEIKNIEKVISDESEYSVVRKNNKTPEPSNKLNVTPITIPAINLRTIQEQS